jgi:hypothetical protein
MTHDPRLDDVEIGELDGSPFRVTPRYRGNLTEADRLGLIASAIRFLLDAIRYDAAGAPKCSGDDCDPASHDVLRSYRRECSDALYSSLNYGYVPNDLSEFVRGVGRKVGIEPAEITRLADDLHELVRRYEWASGIVVTGSRFLFDEDEADDANLPKYVSWADVVKARYGVRARTR